MDSIFNKVKDAVVDQALGGNDRNEERSEQRRDEPRGGENQGYYGRTDGGYNRETNERSHAGMGYSTHGGRRQMVEGGRDTVGYPREEASHQGRDYSEEEQGFGGHGGRPMSSRREDDRLDSTQREYRPAQASGGYGQSSNFSGAEEYARKNASSSDSGLFSQALGFLSGKEKDLQREDVDEREYVRNHKDLYEQGGNGQKDSRSLGQAAALQALKHFTGGSSSNQQSAGKDQNAFIGLAMAEAVKLFDNQSSKGNVPAGETKQDVVSQAAAFALKLFLKSKMDQSAGSGDSGASLMGLASKFLLK
ncbi:Similar to hypothetical protein MYCGRDRAFT_104653 [Mycosphaerella graminicola IPO323]; acc. no. EGP87438 [Pyronema omphalodes CBS 100304]|uniref:DUF7721 domain-containing protein n=1 Tax=Pyronema omphalodes (strain CBS 100304) TaxID=1076935 RepID=U4LU70_PYROM|nr:Similar to hypothetical protein MYCGRDRAFT_104653 [Mycosphaerella graminicola IPO323]; acc. no. EGP87438 [Pyronema omphalodes CBS 100304]